MAQARVALGLSTGDHHILDNTIWIGIFRGFTDNRL